MQHSQRAEANPALERAAMWANECGLPLVVLFVLDPAYPDANIRHYTFMLEGLAETAKAVAERGAAFVCRRGTPPDVAVQIGRKAAVIVADRGYLRHLVAWRTALADEAGCLVEMVEGDGIVPVEEASGKQETAARTFRPRVHDALPRFLDMPRRIDLKHKADGLDVQSDIDLADRDAALEMLDCDRSVPAVETVKGGRAAARRSLDSFLKDDLPKYGDGRADIVDRHVSVMSPYLHFGQISPLELYHAVTDAGGSDGGRKAYVEEMLVRRELAINFVHYAADYDSYGTLPAWARETLEAHKDDPRETVYTRRQLEAGKTDDPYWNAAMREMRVTGYLHNHMRMYWGKRLIAYTKTPQYAYETALYLNNKYFLDGRDANSYANVAWLFGLHDRGWPERDVFGKVRTMTASGLKRKFDVDAYVTWANGL